MLMLLPFERIPSGQFLGVTVRPSMAAAAVIVALVARHSPTAFFPSTWVKKALYVFLLVNLISASLSSNSARALAVTVFLVFAAALAMALAHIAKDVDLEKARWFLLAGAVAVCGIAVYQFFGDLAGLPTNVTGLKPAYSSQVFGFPRVQATALEPLYLANYLLLPLAVVIAGIMTLASSAILVLLYGVALLTLSRGGVAAMVVLTGVLWLIKIKHKDFRGAAAVILALFAAIGLAYGLLAYTVPALTDYRQSRIKVVETYTHQLTNYEFGNTGVDRARTRQLALDLFKSHPLLGAGPGTFGYYAHEHDPNLPVEQIVNNEPLELLGEVGAAGLGTFVLFAALLAWAALKSLWGKARDAAWQWRAALLACLVAVSVQYWSFSTLYIIHLWVAIGLLMGLSEAATKDGSDIRHQ